MYGFFESSIVQCTADRQGGARAGSVRWSTIRAYISAMGGFRVFLPLAACFLVAEAGRVGATVWLSHWTGVADMPGNGPFYASLCKLILT